MSQRGILAVVSGFSGAGKGTLIKELLKRYEGQYALSISATTRKPREGEVHGREYFFLSKEEFENLIEEDALIEHACYVENYYGTPKSYVMQQIEAGRDVILEIEIQGALKVKEKFPNTLMIFITPPSAEELERRLRGRGTESDEVIRNRLHRAAEESEYMDRYEYILVNDELSACVDEMHYLIQAQHGRVRERQALISEMKEQLSQF